MSVTLDWDILQAVAFTVLLLLTGFLYYRQKEQSDKIDKLQSMNATLRQALILTLNFMHDIAPEGTSDRLDRLMDNLNRAGITFNVDELNIGGDVAGRDVIENLTK